MTYKMVEQSYLNLTGKRTGDYTTLKVIVLRNITMADESQVKFTIQELGYQHPEDYEFLFRTSTNIHNNKSSKLHLGVHNKNFLKDPRIKELLLEYII